MNKYSTTNHDGGVRLIWDDVDLLQDQYTDGFKAQLKVVTDGFDNAIILSGCDTTIDSTDEFGSYISWIEGYAAIDDEICFIPAGGVDVDTLGAKWDIIETDITTIEKENETSGQVLYPHKQRIGALVQRGGGDPIYSESQTYLDKLFELANSENLITKGYYKDLNATSNIDWSAGLDYRLVTIKNSISTSADITITIPQASNELNQIIDFDIVDGGTSRNIIITEHLVGDILVDGYDEDIRLISDGTDWNIISRIYKDLPDATTGVKGIVELSDKSEVLRAVAPTNTTQANTPSALQYKWETDVASTNLYGTTKLSTDSLALGITTNTVITPGNLKHISSVQTLTLESGISSGTIKYYIDVLGFVHLWGRAEIVSTTIDSYINIGTLLSGYLPESSVYGSNYGFNLVSNFDPGQFDGSVVKMDIDTSTGVIQLVKLVGNANELAIEFSEITFISAII